MTTARQIVTRAFGELMFLDENETNSDAQMSDGLEALNSMIASWHTDGLSIYYPPGVTWQGEWLSGKVYAALDGVSVNGNTYTCGTAHTSSDDDKPGKSINSGTYWTLYAETSMTFDSTFFFPKQFERGIVAMLAVEMAPMFSIQPSPLTLKKSTDGMSALYGQYFNVPLASSDPALTRMPSQIWPYTIPAVSN